MVSKYFETDWNNVKSTWKIIKSPNSLKTVGSSIPTVLCLNNSGTRNNPYDLDNTFNNYCAYIAETTKKNLKKFT